MSFLFSDKKENLSPFLINISSQEIFIQNVLFPSSLLTINLLSSNVSESPDSLLKNITIYSTIKAKSIIGIFKIINLDFLFYVKASTQTCKIDDNDIYQIKEVDFITIAPPETANNLSTDFTYITSGLKSLFQLGFFYSFTYDLTTSRQKQSKASPPDEKFFFNYNSVKKFMKMKNFVVPIICGYVNSFESTINNKKFTFALVSRRSRYHCGTRYNTRGVDDDGNVANYCETEQIVTYNDMILSFTQIRGSVPVFFQQTGMTAQTEITRSEDLTMQAFSKHFEEIFNDYVMVYCINLLNKKKEGEQILTRAYERQIMKKDNRSIRYYFFDMQNECSGDNYDKIDELMKQVEYVCDIFKFYCENKTTHEVHKNQIGTIRTNCLDCLDRTNVIQMRNSWVVLEKMLISLNVPVEQIFKSEKFFTASSDNKIKECFKELWADNGDYISIQYAGTASTITTVTKNGGHTFMGLLQHGIATLTRVYQQNVEDGFKQVLFDTILQKYYQENFVNPSVENELREKEEKYTTFHDLLVYIGNWNIGGEKLKDTNSVIDWLLPNKEKHPDLYIIGMEEIVKLNATNLMLYSNSERKANLLKIMSDALKSVPGENYILVKDLDLIGIYCVVFIKASLLGYVKNIYTSTIKSGLMGNMGNKGSVLIRFNLNDTSVAIACSHLSAGRRNSESRRSEIIDILAYRFEKFERVSLKDHDCVVFFGDLNSRINLEKDQALELIGEKKYEELLSYDQLAMFKKETSVIANLNEGPINFSPTYKYRFGENEYDLTKRTPSYCDRILFTGMRCEEYNRKEFTLSDHKPIYGLYWLRTKVVNKKRKEEMINEIQERKKELGDMKYERENLKNLNTEMKENFFKSQ